MTMLAQEHRIINLPEINLKLGIRKGFLNGKGVNWLMSFQRNSWETARRESKNLG